MPDQRSTVLVACGREIGARDIENIKEVVGLCSGLSQEELAHTICEHLSLVTASGRHKMKGCLRLLEKLDDLGEIRLPAKRVLKPRKKEIAWTRKTAPRSEICGELPDVGKVALAVVSGASEKALWNEYVDRYHMLGFKKPFGCRIRYFMVSGGGDKLGCILLAGAAKSMGVRDKWIGWSNEARIKNLPWVVNNTRMLIFPWVRVKHLASHVLGRILEKIDVNRIEEIHVELIRNFIRKEKFLRFLVDNAYPIAIDGTQKATRRELLDEAWLQRKVGKEEDGKKQHYVYVLEANLAFQNGMVIPLMSEFLEHGKGDTSNDKQDCETKAFFRLAARLALQQTAEPEKRARALQLGSASQVGNREWDPRGETPRL